MSYASGSTSPEPGQAPANYRDASENASRPRRQVEVSPSSVRGDPHNVVSAYIATFANEGELFIAALRVLLCTVLVIRNFGLQSTFSGDTRHSLALRIVGLGLVIATSVGTMLLASKRKLGPISLSLCACFDAAVCFVSLRTNLQWATAGYLGLNRMPDSAFPALIVFASSVRLYWSSITTSVVLNSVSIVLLLWLDTAANASHFNLQVNDLQVLLLQLGAAGAMAFFAAAAVRRALRRLAAEADRAARGRLHLRSVIQEHHDVRSLLTAARLQLESMDRARKGLDTNRTLTAVERAIIAIDEILNHIASRTLGELSINDDIEEVDPLPIVDSAVAVARCRFPDTVIATRVKQPVPNVLLFGGNRVLAHILVNLLVNACEGSGKQKASRISVHVVQRTRPDRHVLFRIVDNGPGMPLALCEAPFRGGLSTKQRGTGLGLSFIAEIVESSGGKISIRNQVPNGTFVCLRLRCTR